MTLQEAKQKYLGKKVSYKGLLKSKKSVVHKLREIPDADMIVAELDDSVVVNIELLKLD